MELVMAARLEALRPALKRHWAAELRRLPAGPPGSGLITPEMLVLMIDSTLGQLTGGRGRPLATDRRLRECARFRTSSAGCFCGLHSLLAYYVAGARALRTVLPVGTGPVRIRLMRHFTRLARQEVFALCGVCLHRDGAFCQLGAMRRPPERAKKLSPSSAASPARPSATAPSPGGTPG
jgi:hypothetical protein